MTCPDLKNKFTTDVLEMPDLPDLQEVQERVDGPSSPRSMHVVGRFLILLLGVWLPSFAAFLTLAVVARGLTFTFLSHPLETLAELLLVALPPLVNFTLYKSVREGNYLFGLKRGMLSGAALGASLVLAALFVLLGNFNILFPCISVIFLFSAICTLHLTLTIRATKEISSSRSRIIAYLVIGAITTICAAGLLEAKAFFVRYLEVKALSLAPENSKELLRALNVEREERMNCGDSLSAGLSGLFLPIEKSQLSNLYFLVNGKSFVPDSDADYQYMDADYVSRRFVGPKVRGLSLVRSAVVGEVHPDELSAGATWTAVLKNETNDWQNARIEICLDEEAAICGAHLCYEGAEDKWQGVFAGKNAGAGGTATGTGTGTGTRTVPLVQDLGRGRYLIVCGSLPKNHEVKLTLDMVLPINLDRLDRARFNLPFISTSNFFVTGEHSLELFGQGKMKSAKGDLICSESSDGKTVLSGELTEKQILEPLSVTVSRNANAPVAQVSFKNGESPLTNGLGAISIRRKIEEVQSVQPSRLVVVLDGSKESENYLPQIKQALANAPKAVPISLLIASQEDRTIEKPEAISSALGKLDRVKFVGGQDNLRGLVKATQYAGQSQEGMVLWIHGKQPPVNNEMYIVSPNAKRAKLFEFAYDSSETGVSEYFKNHMEISRFTNVDRCADIKADLTKFFHSWQPGRSEYRVVTTIEKTNILPEDVQGQKAALQNPALQNPALKELVTLASRKVANQLAISGRTEDLAVSAQLGRALQVVAPQTSLLLLGAEQNYAESGEYNSQTNPISNEQPTLQGVTESRISPNMVQSTVVQGVNSAGVVRVNNLAGVEAICNIVSNFGELFGIIAGAYRIIRTFFKPGGMRRRDLIVGSLWIAAGLSLPGTINWFIASARDAALFN